LKAKTNKKAARPAGRGGAVASRTSASAGGSGGGSNLIICVVQRGKANPVAKAAMEAGAAGATVFTARGMGMGELMTAIGFPIVPQKEVILIVTTQKSTAKIFGVVRDTADLHTFGMGIACVLPVNQVAGLHAGTTGETSMRA
jgi:nitrogen regulatory protein P-II 1